MEVLLQKQVAFVPLCSGHAANKSAPSRIRLYQVAKSHLSKSDVSNRILQSTF